jgi:hypothetical protein
MKPRFVVIAEKSAELLGFGPYVPSIRGRTVAFSSALPGGRSGAFVGGGDMLRRVVESDGEVASVDSHPAITSDGELVVYGTLRDGRTALLRVGHGAVDARVASGTPLEGAAAIASVGPLGPTISNEGVAGFRASDATGAERACAAGREGDARSCLTRGGITFDGLPVVNDRGELAVRVRWAEGGSIALVTPETTHEVARAGAGGAFLELGRFPSLDDEGRVLFAGVARDGGGIFRSEPGEPTRLARVDTGPEPFESYRGAIAGARGPLYFYATPPGRTLGVYRLDASGEGPLRLLGFGDPLDGSPLTDFALNPVSVDADGNLAIRVALADGRQLILRHDAD